MDDGIQVVAKEIFFAPNENMHIQLSQEFPDYIGVIHKHEFVEIVYILSGSARHYVNGEYITASRGDLFIINAGTPHAFYTEEQDNKQFVAYDLMFTPAFFDKSVGVDGLEGLNGSFMFYSLFSDGQARRPYFRVSGSGYSAFGELFNKIYLEHRGQEKGYQEIIRAYLLQLIIMIFRMDDAAGRQNDKNRSHRAVEYVRSYIQSHYSGHISLQDLADWVYLSPDYLGRCFREITGMTVTAMIQKLRIEQACYLLATTNRTVSDIAASCGFEDLKFFYSVFKKQMGVQPGEYRKCTGIPNTE